MAAEAGCRRLRVCGTVEERTGRPEMKLTVVYRGGMHFCTNAQSGKLMCDESSEMGKAYPSAPELLTAALGSCIGSVLAYYADRHRMNLEGMSVDLDWHIAEEPHRIGSIAVTVTLPLALPEAQLTVLRRVADSCLIHNTLLHPPKISTTVVAKA
jgi:uncharacterized OsmC-like protein